MAIKGEAFELEVKERLELELQNSELGIMPECAKVFHQKSYFSQPRQKTIAMDVVIEVYRPGIEDPLLLWVWECKDYQKKVPVDDVEELHAKIEQIKLHRVKGTLVCRNGFQESAITYAERMGIGLARMLPDGSLIRMQEAVRSRGISRRSAWLGLTQEPTGVFFNSSFFGFSSSGRGVDSLTDMFLDEIGHLLL